MKFLSIALLVFLSVTANAGFEGLSAGTSINVFNRINCGTGLTCTRVKDKFNMVGSGSVSPIVSIATDTTVTIAQCGSTFINSAVARIDLPLPSTSLGCKYTFVTGLGSNFDVNPDNASLILVQTNAAGDAVRNAATGSSITIMAKSATEWAPLSVVGTWSDIN